MDLVEVLVRQVGERAYILETSGKQGYFAQGSWE